MRRWEDCKRADWPIGGNPLAGRMRQRGGQFDGAAVAIDGGRLNGRNFMPPQRFPDDLQPSGQWRIAERALSLSTLGWERRNHRFFRIDEFGLRLGQGRG